MRASTTSIVTLASVAGFAAAQSATSLTSAASAALNLLSPNCQSVVLGLATNSSASQCLHVDLLAGLITTNGSVIPSIDNYLSTICSSAPCSNETLTNTTQTILEGCSSDLSNFGITNQTLEYVVELYPLAREVLCLKTSDPFKANSTASANSTTPTSANATVSSNSTSSYNTTNGTFCATSLLTELSSYLGAPLTTSYITNAALGGNATVVQRLQSIPPSALCDECIFAALDLIEQELPFVGNISVGNSTLNTYLNGQCKSDNLTISTNGTLPTNITITASNSTFSYNITAGNVTYHPNSTVLPNVAKAAASNSSSLMAAATSLASSNVTSSLASVATSAVGNTTALKRRWVGQQ
ncbi:hypothetical protein CI109_103714 [Kwoniella shandongensis]|uniref:Uncharacterized protein n=1 Tax=Kwoniella shandongensis TaxID=1734106 RepID=A0A5M6C7C0_9TREE|nr:uncharacterized protein CI109_000590 [Kwoniella shandongensis]KAA5531018.1 hypothetical protein CI109_000590 [Kwoniella shandongensis]